jgi:hypothetical protein
MATIIVCRQNLHPLFSTGEVGLSLGDYQTMTGIIRISAGRCKTLADAIYRFLGIFPVPIIPLAQFTAFSNLHQHVSLSVTGSGRVKMRDSQLRDSQGCY